MKIRPDQALLEEKIARLENENRLLRESLENSQVTAVLAPESADLAYPSLFDRVPGVFYRFTMDSGGAFRFEHIGANCTDLFGLTAEEILQDGARLFALIPEPDRQAVFAAICVSQENLSPYALDHRVVKPGGEVLWIHATSLPRIAGDGQTIWDGIGLDITGRKQRELELEDYRNIVSTTADFIAYVDHNYVYRIVNQPYLAFNGLTWEEIVGHQVAEIVGEEVFFRVVKEQLDRCFAGEQVHYQAWFTYPVAGRRCMAITYSPYQLGGKIKGALVNGRDITEIMLAREAEEEANNQLALRYRLALLFLTAEPDRLFSEALDLLLAEFTSPYGYFGYLDENGTLICPSMTSAVWQECAIPGKQNRFPEECWADLWGRSLREKESCIANGCLHVPAGHLPLSSVLIVPILSQGELVGQIALANKPSGYEQSDRQRLEGLAAFVGPILSMWLAKERSRDEALRYQEKLGQQNIALNVLLDLRQEEKQQMFSELRKKIDQLISPCLEDLKRCRYLRETEPLLAILERNLEELSLTADRPMPSLFDSLTPMELRIANLVKGGKSSKEIAQVLQLTLRAVYFHRNNLRRKLGLQSAKDNLVSFLNTLT
ncbi:MAG: PAS domain S-box protein [Desulforhopalus sp.]|jgi:PAS domain S-box-containing protein|nr:PAS domain S-box protein [Desulforhopalus sp.]